MLKHAAVSSPLRHNTERNAPTKSKNKNNKIMKLIIIYSSACRDRVIDHPRRHLNTTQNV